MYEEVQHKRAARISTVTFVLLVTLGCSGTSETGISALKGEFSGLRRLRVGAYRIIYEADQGQLAILEVRVGHRGSVYR